MEIAYPYDQIHALVKRVFNIDEVTAGGNGSRDNSILRYSGHLLGGDSSAAYDRLAADLKPLGLTPLFRWDGDRHLIVLVPSLPAARRSNPLVNLIMFLLTLLSVLLTGALYTTGGRLPADFGRMVPFVLQTGWPFAVSLLAILGAHEFGHYLMARHHGVNVTLPYFIPFPLSLFGTMGAFISMKDPPKNRRELLDIGIAGPLAGLAVAVPVLLIGLSLSTLNPLPRAIAPGSSFQVEGNSLLYLLSKLVVFNHLLPQPASYEGLSPLVFWLRYFFTGQPLPLGGLDVTLHPVAWAGWAGILVTALNLIPAGQLDGGHIAYVLFGKKFARRSLPFVLVGLVLLGIFWNGWWLWAALIFFIGRTHAEPLDQITPLDGGRKKLAAFGLVVFLLVFTPVPFNIIG